MALSTSAGVVAAGSLANRNPELRGAGQAADPKREGVYNRVSSKHQPVMGVGVVISAMPGSQDVLVDVWGRQQLCMVMQTVCGAGASSTGIPSEGDLVVVMRPSAGIDVGIVVGSLPKRPGLVTRADNPNNRTFCPDETCHPEQDLWTRTLFNNPDHPLLAASAGRPLDQHPGEWSIVDAEGAGARVFGPTAELLGGPRAKVRVSAIDDSVTMQSGYFHHAHAGGETQIFNRQGFLSGAYSMCTNLYERLGGKKFADIRDKVKGSGAAELLKALREAKPQAIPRVFACVGHAASVFRAWCGIPGTEPDKMVGAVDVHVDQSGRVMMRAKSGFCFSTSDRLPMPVQTRYPWDPSGEDVEGVDKEKAGEFEFSSHKATALELRDAMAWRAGVADSPMRGKLKGYYGLDEAAGTGSGKPEAVFAMENGAFILRGEQGEEIIMADGYITLSAPKGIRFASGKNVEVLAGDDLILKARQSVDMTATNKDVRIKAEHNLQMVAASADRGNVLIESLAVGTAGTNGQSGEAYQGRGIVLRAKGSMVYQDGDRVQLHSASETRVEGDANVTMVAASQAIISAADIVHIECAGKVKASDSEKQEQGKSSKRVYSSLELYPANVLVASSSVQMYTAAGVSMARGKDTANVQWVKPAVAAISAPDYYDDHFDLFYTGYENHQILRELPYTATARKGLRFSYRTDAELGVSGTVALQPTWSVLLQTAGTLGGLTLQSSTWTERTLDDTYPWPGTGAYTGKSYVGFKGESNIITAAVENKVVASVVPWDNLQPTSKGFDEGKSFNLYEVLEG